MTDIIAYCTCVHFVLFMKTFHVNCKSMFVHKDSATVVTFESNFTNTMNNCKVINQLEFLVKGFATHVTDMISGAFMSVLFVSFENGRLVSCVSTSVTTELELLVFFNVMQLQRQV